MAHQSVEAAVIARLAANWTMTPIIAGNEALQTPADGSSFVFIEFPVANDRPAALSKVHREDGAFRIVVSTEIGSGRAKSSDWANLIAAIFRNQHFDGVRCYTPSVSGGRDAGNYFQRTVIVPYFFPYSD